MAVSVKMATVDEPSWQTIAELIDDAAARYGDLEALVDGDVRLDYTGYRDQIIQAARAFMARGVQPGDTIGIWAPNIWEWPIAALGAHMAGAILVPINTRFKGREAAYVIDKAKVKLLFTVTDFLDTDYVALLGAAGAIPTSIALDNVVVMRGAVPDGAHGFGDFMAGGQKIDDAERAARSAAIGPDDLCHIMFTSGTTGAPKGAMLMHGPTVRAYKSWSDVVGLRAGDRYLIVNPFFHSFGMNAGILACLMSGACNLPHPVFDVPSVMRRVDEDRISMLPGPPAIYQTILNHPDLAGFDLSNLRLAVTGAAAIPVQMITDMREVLGFETVVTGYGLTEAHGIATMCRHDDDAETIATTSGRALDDVEVLIVDDDGNEMPRGEPGEIVIRGYNIMRGYLDDPDQTAEAIDGDGWLHSGDIGVMDNRGYVDITDRKKDMFIVGGFNAYPAEIEDTLMSHPSIGGAAVVGVADERLGEVGHAFVIPKPGEAIEPGQLREWCREQMANYKVPRAFTFVEEFPLNASGKVLKFELRDRALAND